MIFRYIMCVHIISAVVILPFILLHLVNTMYFWCDIECLMHIHLTFMVYVLSFEEQVIEVAFTKHMIYKDYTVCQRLNFSTESMLYTSNTVCHRLTPLFNQIYSVLYWSQLLFINKLVGTEIWWSITCLRKKLCTLNHDSWMI